MIARHDRPTEAPSAAASPQAVAEAVNARLHAPVVRVGPGATPGRGATSSGFPALDAATGLGGFPRGRITELIGRPTSGRGTVAARTVAAAGGYCAWIDVCGLLDVDALVRCGVDLQRLFILRPRRPGDALAVAAQVLAGDPFAVVVLDALSDLPPGGDTSSAVARLLRVVGPPLGRGTTAFLVLTSPEQHYRSLAHAAALRVSLARAGLIRRGGVFRGWRARVQVLKSPGAQGGESGIEVWL